MHLTLLAIYTSVSILLLIIGLIGSFRAQRVKLYSKYITLAIFAYGSIASELVIIFISYVHVHSLVTIHLHFLQFFTDKTGHTLTTHIYALLIEIVAFTAIIIFATFVLSQISLNLISRKYKTGQDYQLTEQVLEKVPTLRGKFTLIVYQNEEISDAFTFTIVRFNKLRPVIEDWVILTSKMVQMLDDDELEMVIAHEYSHISEHDTRYSHLIFSLATLIFFDPVLRFIRYAMHEKHEISADIAAVELFKKPKSLAMALFKLLKEHQQTKKGISVTPGLMSKGVALIKRRINLLIEISKSMEQQEK